MHSRADLDHLDQTLYRLREEREAIIRRIFNLEELRCRIIHELHEQREENVRPAAAGD